MMYLDPQALAWQQGYDAYPYGDNPHEESRLVEAWNDGFEFAEQDENPPL